MIGKYTRLQCHFCGYCHIPYITGVPVKCSCCDISFNDLYDICGPLHAYIFSRRIHFRVTASPITISYPDLNLKVESIMATIEHHHIKESKVYYFKTHVTIETYEKYKTAIRVATVPSSRYELADPDSVEAIICDISNRL